MTSNTWSINVKFTIQYLSAIIGAPVNLQLVIMLPDQWNRSQRRNWWKAGFRVINKYPFQLG